MRHGLSGKFLYGTDFISLVKLLGPDGTAKLLRFYGGYTVRFPTLGSLQRRIRRALIRQDVARLREEGMSYKTIERTLSKKYKVGKPAIKNARGFPHNKPPSYEKEKKSIAAEACRDNELLDIIVRNFELWKENGII
jgi:hypothetical protein